VDQKDVIETEAPARQDRKGGILSRLPFRPSDAGPSESFDALGKLVKTRNSKVDLKDLQRAYAFAEESHRGQKRLSGEDFIEHPLQVAIILADLGMDPTTLQAALLHDVVEDTEVTLEELEVDFGSDVARIVDGLTKL